MEKCDEFFPRRYKVQWQRTQLFAEYTIFFYLSEVKVGSRGYCKTGSCVHSTPGIPEDKERGYEQSHKQHVTHKGGSQPFGKSLFKLSSVTWKWRSNINFICIFFSVSPNQIYIGNGSKYRTRLLAHPAIKFLLCNKAPKVFFMENSLFLLLLFCLHNLSGDMLWKGCLCC